VDKSEQVVEEFLSGIGHHPVYEPDGNIPPDFSIESGKIAIEVRRLNQQYAGKGLEETLMPLFFKMKTLLASMGPPTNGSSFYVSYSFARPLNWNHLKPKIRAALEQFVEDPPNAGSRIRIDELFELRFDPRTSAHPHKFLLGGISDTDAGGFIVPEFLSALHHCVREKSLKIAEHRARYPTWWLCLIDHVAGSLSDDAKIVVRNNFIRPLEWQKIITINPTDASDYFEL
jgi:hypothetical protein